MLTPVRGPEARTRAGRCRSLLMVGWSVSRRRCWLILSAESAALLVAHAGHPARSWHFFHTGALLLTRFGLPGAGLHLYQSNPQLQFGPLALLAAWPFAVLPGPLGMMLAVVVMSAAGLAVLWLLAGASPRATRGEVLAAGLLFVPVWSELAARYGHLDDVLALLLAAAALRVVRRQPVLAATLLALAVGCKPWAALFAPLLLAAPRGRRRWLALSVWLCVVSAPWLPFLLADPGTLAVAHFTIPNAADSAVRALGVHAPATPGWCRPAQAALGITVGIVAMLRGKPSQVLLAGIAARMLLDPGSYSYYTAGLLTGTVAADLAGGRRVPWHSLAATVLVYAPAYLYVGSLADPAFSGAMRAGYLISTLVIICATRADNTPAANRTSDTLRRGTAGHTTGSSTHIAGHIAARAARLISLVAGRRR